MIGDWEAKMQLAAETFQSWHSTINDTTDKVKALELNPFSIQLDNFYRNKDDCFIMMNLQEFKAEEYNLKWSDYVKEREKAH